MKKLTIYISDEIVEALRKLAEKEFRDSRSQALIIIRDELERQGCLTTSLEMDNETNKTKTYNTSGGS